MYHVDADLGCAVDAIEFIDKDCSGKKSCSYVAVGTDLGAMKPCPAGLEGYLEIDYKCVTGRSN